ncbi:MAG: Mpo1-like protein [bacterium]
MKSLVDQMSVYAAFHRDPMNKAIHFVFVPAIIWSGMVLLSVPPGVLVGGVEVKASMVVAALLLLYYLALDYPLGVAMVALFTVLEGTALQLAAQGWQVGLAVGGTVFVVSWVVQVVGHSAFEHNRPALTVNLWQVFVAPIFVVAEWVFALGWRKDLRHAVEQGMQQHQQVS